MKLKKLIRALMLLLIVSCRGTLTAYGQTADSIKFSYPETRVLLNKYHVYDKLKQYADSCDVQEKEFRLRIKADSVKLYDKEQTIFAQKKTIDAAVEISNELNREVIWKKIWRGVSLAYSAIAGGAVITYLLTK